MVSEALIRAAVADVIQAAVGADPKVYPYWVLGRELAEWPGAVRLDDSDLAHGYVVRWDGVPFVSGPNQQWRFQVTGLHSYVQGSSDDTFGAAIEAIVRALSPEPGILTLSEGCQVNHEGLVVETLDIWPAGDSELVHLMQGTILVNVFVC